MFDEQENCPICNKPTKGSDMFCSSLCKSKDTFRANNDEDADAQSRKKIPPPFSSPLFGATRAGAGGPSTESSTFSSRGGKTAGGGTTSSSSNGSSRTSSPSLSPSPFNAAVDAVNGSPPSHFTLPPPAHPTSTPIHIPASSSKKSKKDGSSDSASIPRSGEETLKYRRKPGFTNNFTSPIALLPTVPHHQSSKASSSSSALGSPRFSPVTYHASVHSTPGGRCDRPGCSVHHLVESSSVPKASQLQQHLSDLLPHGSEDMLGLTKGNGHHQPSNGKLPFGNDADFFPAHNHSAFAIMQSHQQNQHQHHHSQHEVNKHSNLVPAEARTKPNGAPLMERRRSIPAYNNMSGSFKSSMTPPALSAVTAARVSPPQPQPLQQQQPSSLGMERSSRAGDRDRGGDREGRGRSRQRERESHERDEEESDVGRERSLGRRSRSRHRSRARSPGPGRSRSSARRSDRGGDSEDERVSGGEADTRGRNNRRSFGSHHHAPPKLNQLQPIEDEGFSPVFLSDHDKKSSSSSRGSSNSSAASTSQSQDDGSLAGESSDGGEEETRPGRETTARGRRPTVLLPTNPAGFRVDALTDLAGRRSSSGKSKDRNETEQQHVRGRMNVMRIAGGL